MLLINARLPSRVTSDGALVPLAEQDPDAWDVAAIAEGIALVENALAQRSIGPYTVQAAIAALHAEAHDGAATDWPQILALYDVLECFGPNPGRHVDRAVAIGEVHGPLAGLEALAGLDEQLHHGDRHRVHAVRGHLLVNAGRSHAGARAFERAAREAKTPAERRHLTTRAAQASARQPSASAPPRSSSTSRSRAPTP